MGIIKHIGTVNRAIAGRKYIELGKRFENMRTTFEFYIPTYKGGKGNNGVNVSGVPLRTAGTGKMHCGNYYSFEFSGDKLKES